MHFFFHIGRAMEDHARSVIRPRQTAGFSVLELIVALAIFVMITATLLFNYNSFNKRITLDTLAHQVAQWVRGAQVSAMSVKRSRADTGVFPGYGLHFDMTKPGLFVYFADLNGNKVYDAGGTCGSALSECELEIPILQGNRLYSLCGDLPSGGITTSQCGALGTSQTFDILFVRPDPDAIIQGDLNGGAFPTPYSRAEVTVISPKNYQRTVAVWTTGQVSVR